MNNDPSTATRPVFLSADLHATAANLVVRERRASVSLLQRHLTLGHTQALQLMASLARAGVVDEPNPVGRYHVALSRLRPQDLRVSHLDCHVRTIADLAQYLIDSHGYESTVVMPMLGAPFEFEGEDLKSLVAEVLAGRPGNPVGAVALALADLSQVAARLPSATVRDALLAEVGRLPEQIDRTWDAFTWRRAGMLRVVRYIQRRMMEDITVHPCPFEAFIFEFLRPQGRAFEVSVPRREHVMPCAYLREKAVELLRYGIPTDEVADWLEPYVHIAVIEKADAPQLVGRKGLPDRTPD